MLEKLPVKIIAMATTLVVTTLPFFASPALAEKIRVRVTRVCATYNDDGEPNTRRLKVGGYYALFKYMRFKNGNDGAKVWVFDEDTQERRTVNVPTRCLARSEGQVIEY